MYSQRTSSSVSVMSHQITCSYVSTYTNVRRCAFRYCRKMLLASRTSGNSTRKATVYPATLPFVINTPHHQNLKVIL